MEIAAARIPQASMRGTPNAANSIPDNAQPSQLEPSEAYLGRTTEAAEATRALVGGISTVGTAALTLPMAVVGGGVLGTAFGMGIGPAVAAVTTSGAKDFIVSSLSTTGRGTAWGMTLGGVTALAGALVTGRTLANGAAFVMGARDPEKAAGSVKRSGPIAETATQLFAGLGALSGAIGGGLTGAGLVTTGSLLFKGFQMDGLGAAALVGGGVGAALGLIVSGRGSYALAKGIERGGRALATGVKTGMGALQGLDIKGKGESTGINLTNLPKLNINAEGAKTAMIAVAAGTASGGLSALPILGLAVPGIELIGASETKDHEAMVMAASSAAFNVLGTGLLMATGNPAWMIPAGIAGGIAGACLATH
jgi:hypothetical protein